MKHKPMGLYKNYVDRWTGKPHFKTKCEIKEENKQMSHTPTPQELHLRSALENEGYAKERIEEIVIRDRAYDDLVKACQKALYRYKTQWRGSEYVEEERLLIEALTKAGVK